MKTILLASASVFAFSGMAFADGHEHSHTVTFSGEAALGYNDTPEGDEDGFYWDLDIDVALTMSLDNGLTAAASFGFEAADDTGGNLGQDLVSSDFVLSVSNDMGGLFFGDTGPAADKHWAAAGDMESDGFSANDGAETYLRGDISLAGVDASVSYAIDDEDYDADGEQLEQLSVGASGSLGQFSFAVAYQEESLGAGPAGDADYNGDEIFGVSAGGSFAGADVTVAYVENSTDDTSSTGVQVAYPFGPVTVTAYYVMEDGPGDTDPDDNLGVTVAYVSGPVSITLDYDDDQGVSKTAIDASYDVGNGITVLAGVYTADDFDGDDYYLAATYDLGGGAEILVSYAEDGEGDDEVGGPEYQGGTTVELSLDF